MSKVSSASGSALLALLGLALIWGYNWVQMKIAVHYAPPFTFAAMRVVLAGLSLFLALACLRKPLWPREITGTFWVGTLQTAGVYGLVGLALVTGGAGKTSVLVYTMPLWTVLLAWLALGERVRGVQWLAIGLSVVGLLFILDPIHLNGSVLSKGLAVLAGLSWAGGAVLAKKVRQRVELDLLSFTTWQTLFAAIPLLVLAILVPSDPVVWSPAFGFALVYNVIPGTAVATLLWLYILSRFSAGTAALGMLLNPVIGVLTAWVQLGEQPGWAEAIGMGLILAALAINSLHSLHVQTHPLPTALKVSD